MPLSAADIDLCERLAYNIRRHIVNTIIYNGEGHGASALSCADIIAVLYGKIMKVDPKNPKWHERDRFLLSGGHKCLALYGALVEKSYIEEEVLGQYNKLNTIVPGHPDMKKLPGVDFSTGSLGHGLPVACGMALAARREKSPRRMYVIMGDGEHGEGSVWESASFASHKGLDNITVIVDRNGLQIHGSTCIVANTAPLEERYAAFGWSVRTIDGHNITEIYDALAETPFEKGKPSVIIANTIKGKGISFLENDPSYHHWHPGEKESQLALAEMAEYGRRWA